MSTTDTFPRPYVFIQCIWLGPSYILMMAVGRHLGFYRTENSAIRSADAENPWARTKHGVDRMHRLRDIHL